MDDQELRMRQIEMDRAQPYVSIEYRQNMVDEIRATLGDSVLRLEFKQPLPLTTEDVTDMSNKLRENIKELMQ